MKDSTQRGRAAGAMMPYRVFAANPKIRNVLEGIQKSLPRQPGINHIRTFSINKAKYS